MTLRLSRLLAAVPLCACAAAAPAPVLPAAHPANPEAAETPFARPADVMAPAMMAAASPAPAPAPLAAAPPPPASRPGIAAVGTVRAVDAANRSVTIEHAPIRALGWPSMTMEFQAAPGVDLSAVRPGARVGFTLGAPDADGNRPVETLEPGR